MSHRTHCDILSDMKIMNFLILFFLFSILSTAPVSAQEWGIPLLNSTIDANPKSLVVGDRVDLTLTAKDKDNKPANLDRKFKFVILNPKPGQTCFTIDNTLKDDATVRGYCEAKGDSGNMEITTEPEEKSSFEFNGTRYESWLHTRYNAMFYDAREFCQESAVAPSAVTLVKQNDIAVRLDWQHVDKFVGTYDVIYGNKPGEYTKKRTLTDKSLIIDSLDSNQEYYFKIQANSACKWTATSNLYKYVPMTGAVSQAVDKPKTNPSPSGLSKPTKNPDAFKTNPVNLATLSATAVATPSALPNVNSETSSKPSLITQAWNSIASFFARFF